MKNLISKTLIKEEILFCRMNFYDTK